MGSEGVIQSMRITVSFLSTLLVLVGCSKRPAEAPTSQEEAAKQSEQVPLVKAESPSLQIRWTQEVDVFGLKRISDIDLLFAQPVGLGGNTDGPTWINESDESARPITCQDYFDLLEKGYFPPTTFDMTMTGFFQRRCDTLRLLKDAAPSKRSFVKSFSFGWVSLAELPATLAPDWDADDEVESKRRGKSWAEAYPEDTVDRFEAREPIGIKITASDFTTYIELFAWADFNHDGTEDVLLFLSSYANGGTFRMYSHHILTRLQPDGPLEQVDVESDTPPI